MGVLGDVLGVPLSGELHKWSGLGVVGELVSGVRTALGGWVVLGRAVGVLGGCGKVGCVGLRGSGPASSILVRCVGRQLWLWYVGVVDRLLVQVLGRS